MRFRLRDEIFWFCGADLGTLAIPRAAEGPIMSGVAVNLLEDEATIMRGAIQGVRGCKKGGREYVYKGRTRMPAESFSSSIWAMGGAMGNRSGSLESTWREVAGLEEDEEALTLPSVKLATCKVLLVTPVAV